MIRPPWIFQVQAKTSTVRPVFPDYLSVSYDYGFRQNFSTTHTLINLTENLRQALEERKIDCGIFVDLQKAFDTVEHEIFLSKLDHYSVRGLTNNWFKSYLTDRKQNVLIFFHQYLMIGLLLFQLNILIKHLAQLKKRFLNTHLRLYPMVKILLYPALFSLGIMHNKS